MASAATQLNVTTRQRWSPDAPEREVAAPELYDYCYWPYRSLVPAQDQLCSSNLLFQSFAVAGVPALQDVCTAIRRDIGVGRTVFGTKFDGTTLSWEFYFYDYERLDRKVSLSRVAASISSLADCKLPINEARPYFMFSLDFDAHFDKSRSEGRAVIDKANLYFGNPDCSVSSGMSYGLTRQGITFDNLYYFYDAEKEYEQVLQKLLCSAHLDLGKFCVDDVVWPFMRPRGSDKGCIVIANKRHNDGIYFSRIRLPQLIYFLRRLNYPDAIINYVESHCHELEHLLYDVGMDYRMRNGKVEILKSSFYGMF